ncbi:MAG: tetratricopeptide repeat protein [Nitrospinae bacterium]|jgi:tetratricopeptide (TPR) repeat protein|nr:tetratricopeptide repeat protein [Nitrospinota bacterium]MDA1109282.1 tetratricopeptide repeat protein [Nitrospinota bacterium]
MNELQQLLNDLKNPSPATRNHATQELWSLWYQEAGSQAEEQLNQGTRLMGENQMEDARQVFEDLLESYPDFAEAHNKLATLLFLQDELEESVVECERTIQINPHHFGALHGMGMCLYKLARYDEALKCFKRAIEIQPYADANREFIAQCLGKLN